MDEITRRYFDELTRVRESGADLLEQPFMSGVQRTVVEKYSEPAHFVYELIQNADDAGATNARFILSSDELIFAHNGKRHFTVSNPQTEREDRDAGTLGDVNSITAIALSNKTDEATIGKFGVGFKAVFTYTNTPHIYGPTLCFRIERFIVPKLLEEDRPDRKKDETLFVFPFDKPDVDNNTAVKEITDRLSSLVFPVLFLNSLQRIDFIAPSMTGSYAESILEEHAYTYGERDVLAQLVGFDVGGQQGSSEKLWLFSSCNEDGHKCSVGFFVGDDGSIRPRQMPAFCFFPTKVTTGLQFIVNAPFLLTDSREGIRYGDEHNMAMVEELGELAATSLEILCDIGANSGRRIVSDNMFDVIPYDSTYGFGYDYDIWYGRPSSSGNTLSFRPIKEALKSKVRHGSVLPGVDGYYKATESCVIESARLVELLEEDLLRDLLGAGSVTQVLPGLRYGDMERQLSNFLKGIGVRFLSDIDLLGKLNGPFIAQRDAKWLGDLHGYIASSKSRTDKSRNLPVFLDSNGIPCAPFNAHGEEILFLPSEDAEDYHVLSEGSLSHEGTRKLAEALGLKEPSLRDRIFAKVLPKLVGEGGPRDSTAFAAVYRYYMEGEEGRSFARQIADYGFLAWKSALGPYPHGAKASELYYPTDELERYFSPKPGTKFLDLDFYHGVISDRDGLRVFFSDLGVDLAPRVLTKSLSPWEAHEMDYHWSYSTPSQNAESWMESELDGCDGGLAYLGRTADWDYSNVLWNVLARFSDEQCDGGPLSSKLAGTHKFFYYSPGTETYEPQVITDLKRRAWLCDRDGNPVSPDGVDKSQLSERYDLTSRGGSALADFLGIREPVLVELSREERMAADLDALARQCGVEGFEEMMENPAFTQRLVGLMRAFGHNSLVEDVTADLSDNGRTNASNAAEAALGSLETGRPQHVGHGEGMAEGLAHNEQGTADRRGAEPPTRADEATEADADSQEMVRVREHFRSLPGEQGLNEVASDIAQRVSRRRRKRNGEKKERNTNHDAKKDRQGNEADDRTQDAEDDDELIPAVVDYEKRTERKRERCAREIDNIEYEERLRNAAIAAETYSFKWFCSLIELESLFDRTGGGREEFTIAFSKVRLEDGMERTLVLEQPNRSIPSSVEDLSNIPLVLEFSDSMSHVEVEVASVRNYTLRARLKDGAEVAGLDLSKVVEARIEVRNPTFLLEELRKRFLGLALKDTFNMRDSLPDNIEFVYGPPGTGKTTYLARNVLIPLMSGRDDLRVLVLAPTNKAADVLARKIVECSGGTDKCAGWLIRFGLTEDPLLEGSGIYKDKTFDYSSLSRSVMVTTIARFPYDYFMLSDGHKPLRSFDWDYVVFDEASMISCAQIVYPLYKANPRKFVVAGDPHQIAPVLKADLWQDENIYSMVELESFKDPHTVPHDYEVTLLTTQYRSVPSIGRVYGELSYDGLLSSHRSESDADRRFLGKGLAEHPINVVSFPVSPYESVYKPKRIARKSAYHPYSALLTYELVRHLASRAGTLARDRTVSIGVVSPYRAQADMLSGLIAQLRLDQNVRVQAGTIHGFQGDECDVMIVVLNTPPSISAKPGMFLNKRNILNVSVSRARDSLILLVPDENTRGRSNLVEINRLDRICSGIPDTATHTSRDIERMIFGSPTHIEDNCFTTGHQSVNVYGRPEQSYEIRSENQAIDIQIHEAVQHGVPTDNVTTLPPTIDTEQPRVSVDTKPGTTAAQSRKAVTKSVSGRAWTQEELRTLRTKYGMYSNLPRSLLMLFPGWSLTEIDSKAMELGLIKNSPRRATGGQRPKSTTAGSMSTGTASREGLRKGKAETKRERQERLRNRPWEQDEDIVLRRNYPVYGSDMIKWDKKLTGRKRKAIEERARLLGL